MNKEVLQSFSKKWGMGEQEVYTIFTMIRDSGRKYGKTSRALMTFNVQLSPRQLKYFYRKVKLYETYRIGKKGKPKNWSILLRKKT